MPIIKEQNGPKALSESLLGLAEDLAREIQNSKELGLPMILESEFVQSNRIWVTVIWDRWAGVPFRNRTPVIYRSYEIAKGTDFRTRIAIAQGLTPQEAVLEGKLQYEIKIVDMPNLQYNLHDIYKTFEELGGFQQASRDIRVSLWLPNSDMVNKCINFLLVKYPGTEKNWRPYGNVSIDLHESDIFNGTVP